MLAKWQSIDDEIWAKIIVLERNRRVAKAYARAPVLTVNGSDDGFDGFRIGLAGFDNPMRDAKTEDVKRHIGQVRRLNAGALLALHCPTDIKYLTFGAEIFLTMSIRRQLYNG